MMMKKLLPALLCFLWCPSGNPFPAGAAIDAQVKKVMSNTHANGMAVAVVDKGKVGYVQAYGIRNAKGDPLTIDTVMYGASITKTVLAYTTMQLVDQGKLSLDTPIKDDLDQPLTTYGPDPVFPDKHGPYPIWPLIHAGKRSHPHVPHPFHRLQQLLVHRARSEAAHPFRPGTRFSYSGEGFILLQFVIEHGRKAQGLGLDVGDLTNAIFDRLGMTRTSLVWRPDFASNLADGWNDKGAATGARSRAKVRAAGSMDTTISDLPKFAAALVSGDGLTAASRAEMTKPQLHITTAHQFPAFGPELAGQRAAKGSGCGARRRRLRRPAGPRLLQGRP